MNKPEIAKRMARQSKSSVGAAADCLDSMVRQIIHDLRRGKNTRLPGLGQFTRDSAGNVAFRQEGTKRRD
jgi:nucleoid DNA-binding protein